MKRPASFARADFVRSPTNAQAIDALDAWPDWPGATLVLVGAEGVGKSHLAGEWAGRAGALRLDPAQTDFSAAGSRPVLLEDADRGPTDETLFHLLNMAGASGGVLLTARTLPGQWPAALPDLRSRLNALYVAEITPPDDVVLEGVLRKFFRERNIRPAEDVYPYLLRRIERSVPAALDIVSRLDEVADAEHRDITRALARQILESDDETLNLFD
ncbi:chromosomal replication initiator DnaA [Caulobacter sp. KR2-114]|uniref:chromosomal replication initiator DnaA n=1 Tax=Caulobacter sp. KR2-114 TaxID=3400912 RepID=UPI003C0B22AE